MARASVGLGRLTRLVPGAMAAVFLALAAWGLEWIQTRAAGHASVEAVVAAMVLGTILRTVAGPRAALDPGLRRTEKWCLKAAVVLLGASVQFAALLRSGPELLLMIVAMMVIGLASGMVLGHVLGLSWDSAALVACGNAVCGNSAIAAVATVIRAKRTSVASAIAVTGLVSVVMVLVLPPLQPLLNLTFHEYGVLAGMTIAAVPQVLAATFPVSEVSGEIGTLVKLVRVLMLGPVILSMAVLSGMRAAASGAEEQIRLRDYIPWFVVGFAVLALARSLGVIPDAAAETMRAAADGLMVLALAALGASVDLRAVVRVGRPVALAVVGTIGVLIVLTMTAIKGFGA